MSDTKKAKGKAKGKPQAAKMPEGGMSCLNAAAKVLAEKGEPMTCKEMVDAMAAKGYWTTPGGKTPRESLNGAKSASHRSASTSVSPGRERASPV